MALALSSIGLPSPGDLAILDRALEAALLFGAMLGEMLAGRRLRYAGRGFELPDDGALCVMGVHPKYPDAPDGVFELVVDSSDPVAQAQWWAARTGGRPGTSAVVMMMSTSRAWAANWRRWRCPMPIPAQDRKSVV